jgi:hypothetical protein
MDRYDVEFKQRRWGTKPTIGGVFIKCERPANAAREKFQCESIPRISQCENIPVREYLSARISREYPENIPRISQCENIPMREISMRETPKEHSQCRLQQPSPMPKRTRRKGTSKNTRCKHRMQTPDAGQKTPPMQEPAKTPDERPGQETGQYQAAAGQ